MRSIDNGTRRTRARKRLGQHFLKDSSAAVRIVASAGIHPTDLVLEIGPGRGALTGLLLEQASFVVGIELDDGLCEVLQRRFAASENLLVINRDILDVDFSELIHAQGFDRAVLVGNLPYNITGTVVEKILDSRQVLKRAIVMLQREVAKRIVSPPNVKDYGILSIAVQIRTRPERLFDLAPESFDPSPKVHSSVVSLEFQQEPPIRLTDESLFFKVVRMGFNQRRKMLKNTIVNLVGGDAEVLNNLLLEADVDPRARPESVSVEHYERICQKLLCLKHRQDGTAVEA